MLLTGVAWNISWFVLQACIILASSLSGLRRLPEPLPA